MDSTTGKRPGAGVVPSFDGNVTVVAIRTPSSIGTSTSSATLWYVGAGSTGGGAAARTAACVGGAVNEPVVVTASAVAATSTRTRPVALMLRPSRRARRPQGSLYDGTSRR